MKQFEYNLLFISILTFVLFVFKPYVLMLLSIYLLIFCGLYYLKKPIQYYVVVILFSVMCNRTLNSQVLVDYVLILILFIYTLYFVVKEKKCIVGHLLLPLIIFSIYSTLSLIWTPVLTYGIDGLFAVLEGYLVYFIITNRLKTNVSFQTVSKIASYILLTLTLEIIYFYIRVGPINMIENKNLLHLGWGMSNIIATIYVFLIPLAMYKYTKYKSAWYSFLDFFNFIGLLLTLSRGAYLGVFISINLFIFYFVRKKWVWRYCVLLLLSSSVLLVKYKLNTIFNLFINSRNRDKLYLIGWNSFKSHLLFGQGIKSSEYVIFEQIGKQYMHYHHFVLQIAATLGILGLVILFWMMIQWFVILDKNTPFIRCVSFSIIGSILHQSVDVSFDLYFFGVYFYLLMGVVEVYRHYNKDDSLKMKVL